MRTTMGGASSGKGAAGGGGVPSQFQQL